jgi:hypothetical protein
MSREYDTIAERHGGLRLDPFWKTWRGKLVLLAAWLVSIGAGAVIAWTAKKLLNL